MSLNIEMQNQGNFLFKRRSYIPIFLLIITLTIYIFTDKFNIEESNNFIFKNYKIFSLAVSLTGLLIRVKVVGHTPPKTSGRNTNVGQVAEELNTTGLYSLVRHPLYVGNYLMWLGVLMLTLNLYFIIISTLLYFIYYERIMFAEEQFIIAKFQDQYKDYSKVTPAFISNFKHYKKPIYLFNLKKVIKKEKNGFVAVFALFWLFDWVENVMMNDITYFECNYWFYSALISVILYLILKIMKKKKMLN
jgi:protein-S-isoprenylcysteine O-methyltransferase Ste14